MTARVMVWLSGTDLISVNSPHFIAVGERMRDQVPTPGTDLGNPSRMGKRILIRFALGNVSSNGQNLVNFTVRSPN